MIECQPHDQARAALIIDKGNHQIGLSCGFVENLVLDNIRAEVGDQCDLAGVVVRLIAAAKWSSHERQLRHAQLFKFVAGDRLSLQLFLCQPLVEGNDLLELLKPR